MLKYLISYFTKTEKILWCSSVILIVISFFIFDGESILTLAASLIGVTSLIFGAKGNPLGQLLIIVFSIMYGIISFTFRYYGEMMTYLGMTAPMAVFALISWIKNPYKSNKAEVKVNRIKKKEIPVIVLLTTAVTILFFFILKKFGPQTYCQAPYRSLQALLLFICLSEEVHFLQPLTPLTILY